MDSKAKWMPPVALLVATVLLTGCCVQAGCGNDCNCPNEQSCTNGAAKASCCWTGTNCVKTQSDVNNCGSCGKVCPAPLGATAVCTAGQCSSQCKLGYTLCGTQCVKSDSDINNCGTCGKVCPAPPGATVVCTAGQCSSQCKSGYTLCGSQCVAACTCPAICPDTTISFSLASTPAITTSEENTINLDGGSGSVTIPSGQTVTTQVQTGSLLFNTSCYNFGCNSVVGSTFDTAPTFTVNGVSSTLDVNGQSGDGSSSVGLLFSTGKAPTDIKLPGCQTLSVLSQAETGYDNFGPPATRITSHASFSLACFT